MRHWFRGFAVAGALAVAASAAAQPYQFVVDFDALSVGTGDFGFDAFGDTLFHHSLSDPIDYSWPAVGAFVTGSAPITLTLMDYDPNTGMEEIVFVTSVGGGTTNFYLSGGDNVPRSFTSALFTSMAEFSIDDLTLGLTDVPFGIPEPATWGLLIGGFALAGVSLRNRRNRASATA